MNEIKREMGVCPKCGDNETRMENYKINFNCLWTMWYCPNCKKSWREYYTLTYDGYTYNGKTYDADGKECTDI